MGGDTVFVHVYQGDSVGVTVTVRETVGVAVGTAVQDEDQVAVEPVREMLALAVTLGDAEPDVLKVRVGLIDWERDCVGVGVWLVKVTEPWVPVWLSVGVGDGVRDRL